MQLTYDVTNVCAKDYLAAYFEARHDVLTLFDTCDNKYYMFYDCYSTIQGLSELRLIRRMIIILTSDRNCCLLAQWPPLYLWVAIHAFMISLFVNI